MAIIKLYFQFWRSTIEVDISVQAFNHAIQKITYAPLLVTQFKVYNGVSIVSCILSSSNYSRIVIIAGDF